MHLLNTAKLLHENPYTGDRIIKASIVHLEPSLLRDTLKSQQQQQAHDNNTDEEGVLSVLSLTHDGSDGPVNGTAETRQRGPELVAIKFLSSSTSYADGFDSSSDDDEADDEDEGDGSDTTLKQKPLAHGWTAIGQTDVPKNVKFGLKAKREIAALRAAQGHPNVIFFRICIFFSLVKILPCYDNGVLKTSVVSMYDRWCRSWDSRDIKSPTCSRNPVDRKRTHRQRIWAFHQDPLEDLSLYRPYLLAGVSFSLTQEASQHRHLHYCNRLQLPFSRMAPRTCLHPSVRVQDGIATTMTLTSVRAYTRLILKALLRPSFTYFTGYFRVNQDLVGSSCRWFTTRCRILSRLVGQRRDLLWWRHVCDRSWKDWLGSMMKLG